MQVDPSICAATYISGKGRKGGGEEDISKLFTAKLELLSRKIYSFFQITPKKEK